MLHEFFGHSGGFIQRTCPQQAETERGWAKGDHRGYTAALGSIPKDQSEVSGSDFFDC
jgi:hypothetical protein